MKPANLLRHGGTRGLWAAVAVLALAGASDAATAKDRKRERVHADSAVEAPKAKAEGKGYIGVYMQELTDEVREGLDLDVKSGVLVSGVEDDGPAAEAGIEEGDVIVSFNGTAVTSPDDLADAVRGLAPGTKVGVAVSRDGKSRAVTVTVGERPERRALRMKHEGGPMWEMHGDDFAPMINRTLSIVGGARLGIEAHEIENDELGSYFGLKEGKGVLVLSVEENSVAEKAGVKAGDIIREVGEEQISEVGDIREALQDYEEGDAFDITVFRHGKSATLKATMDEQAGEFSFVAPRGGAYKWHGSTPAPRVWVDRHEMSDDLRRELDQLKKEMKALKEELEQRHDG